MKNFWETLGGIVTDVAVAAKDDYISDKFTADDENIQTRLDDMLDAQQHEAQEEAKRLEAERDAKLQKLMMIGGAGFLALAVLVIATK